MTLSVDPCTRYLNQGHVCCFFFSIQTATVLSIIIEFFKNHKFKCITIIFIIPRYLFCYVWNLRVNNIFSMNAVSGMVVIGRHKIHITVLFHLYCKSVLNWLFILCRIRKMYKSVEVSRYCWYRNPRFFFQTDNYIRPYIFEIINILNK